VLQSYSGCCALQELGIADAAQRQLILAAAVDYAAGRSTPDNSSEQQQQQHVSQLEQQQELDDELYCGWEDCLDEDCAPAWPTADAEEPTEAAMDAWGVDDSLGGQQQQQGMPLQPVQAHACNTAAGEGGQRTNNSSSDVMYAATITGQSSIRGWLRHGQQQQHSGVQQQQQQQQHNQQQAGQMQPDAVKQQWQSLFNKPGKVLAPMQPLQPRQRPKSQMQLGRGGKLQQPQPQPQQQQRTADQQMLASLPTTRSSPLPRCVQDACLRCSRRCLLGYTLAVVLSASQVTWDRVMTCGSSHHLEW
jgi:hypothetical protein